MNSPTSMPAPMPALALPRLSTLAGILGDPVRLLWLGIGFQVALFVPSLIAAGFDERLVRDVAVWAKPLKFQVSLSVLMATLLIAFAHLTPDRRNGVTVRLAAWLVVASSTFDTAYFTFQAARGRASHFNKDTPFEAAMYPASGVAAILILVGSAIVGVAVWRSMRGRMDGLSAGLVLGLVLGSILTLLTASVMAADLIHETGRWAGGLRSDATGLPFVGWSTTGGDLRVPHFFATHLMQALPLAGWLADRTAPDRRDAILTLATVVGIALVAATFAQAAMGRPFLAI
jgi:hypothetical protein